MNEKNMIKMQDPTSNEGNCFSIKINHQQN